MKQRGTRLLHESQEFLLVEDGFNEDTRSVTVHARPDSELLPGEATVTWGALGRWHAVARWKPGALEIPKPDHLAHRALIAEAVEAYDERRPPRPEQPLAWVARRDGDFETAVDATLPMGLAVPLHLDGERARRFGDDVVPIEGLGAFLTHLAREGYAGALWDGTAPIFFCLDDEEQIQFLRVRQGDGETIEISILDTTDEWTPYDGAEDIEILDNQDACDRRLVDVLGRTPVLDWPEAGRLFAIGPERGVPAVIGPDEDRDEDHGVLFTSQAGADAYLAQAELDHEVFEVDDVATFLAEGPLREMAVVLNPGGHRALCATFWSDGAAAVLDSFSGFWRVDASGARLVD